MNNVPVAMSETDGNDLGGGDQSLTDAVQLSINAIEDGNDCCLTLEGTISLMLDIKHGKLRFCSPSSSLC